MTVDTFDIAFIKYNPKLGDIFGRGASMFIGVLQYLLNNQNFGIEKEGKKWVYNTSDQWGQYIGYSSRQVERIISKLSDQGIIIIQKLSRCKSNRTNYYTVDEAKLDALLKAKEAGETQTNSLLLQQETPLQVNNKTFIDKKSEAFRHEGEFITKKTNKEINSKSDEEASSLADIDQPNIPISKSQKDQVEQVKNIKAISNNTKAKSPGYTPNGKTSIAQEMLSIWNKILEKTPTIMSKQLAPLLVAAYKNKFNSEMEKWEHYCKTIASSHYLTGDTFTLSLLWALKYTTIERIKNLEFGVKEIDVASYSQTDAISHIQTLNEGQKCKEMRLKLLSLFGENAYRNWFSRISLQVIDNKVCFQAENRFMQDYITAHYGQVFKKC
ncbi:DnaA N-terminal domain-containing protein [Candidatus Paracaedibacter symbiosus]|uniref:DnaA N-terminal domain-containing protein n=1 Tax=Candidatus Paracaedibacter symbiosus TaxID=244582 RepID=UPI000509EF48|nr:DnaA N-terminal domain-containing protein [Candidatus Paracaedibacter symbiosus]